jgi:hypothetical protein
MQNTNAITPETTDTMPAAVRFAIESNGAKCTAWRTLDKRMNEDDARFVFESAGKPDDLNTEGPWRHKLVRLIVNRYGEEIDRRVLDERTEA